MLRIRPNHFTRHTITINYHRTAQHSLCYIFPKCQPGKTLAEVVEALLERDGSVVPGQAKRLCRWGEHFKELLNHATLPEHRIFTTGYHRYTQFSNVTCRRAGVPDRKFVKKLYLSQRSLDVQSFWDTSAALNCPYLLHIFFTIPVVIGYL